MSATAPLRTDNKIDAVITKNLAKFDKPGVTSIRPGLRISGGTLTSDRAIVVGVRKKMANLPRAERLPPKVGGIPVDVRPVSPSEALRATDPEAFAQQLAGVPSGNIPLDMQTPNFPLERNVKGELISPQVDKALARVALRRPGGATTQYPKLPAATLQPITDNFTLTCFVSPDAGWPTLEPFLNSVNTTLSVGMFEFTSPHIVTTVANRMQGKTLNLVLDDPSYDTTFREQTDDVTHQQLSTAVGAGFNFAWAPEGSDPHCSVHLFPAAYHIKVAVADSAAFFLSSGNFNTSNQPNIDPNQHPAPNDMLTARQSDRDWHVIVRHAGLAKVFEDSVILRDLNLAKSGQQPAAPPNLAGPGNSLGKPFPKFFAPKTFTGLMTIQPALTPDNFVDVILPLIQGAQTSFWMQTQYIKPSKTFINDVKTVPVGQRSILERLIDAVATLVKRGLDVRIILDARVTSSAIEQLQDPGGIGSRVLRQANVHNKSMIIDSTTVVIGSQNWSTEGVDTNRDASLAIHNPDLVAYCKTIFLSDWDNMTIPQEDPSPP